MLHRLEIGSPDEASDRDIGATNNGVGDRITFITIMPHIVALIQIKLNTCQLVLGSCQIGGYALIIDLSLTTLNTGRIGYILVIGDTTILLALEVVTVEERLQLIAVSNVTAKKAPPEILVGLIIVRTLGVDIVHGGSHLNGLAHIAREKHLGAVLVAIFVASSGVGNERHGNARVEKTLGLNTWQPTLNDIFKEKVAVGLTLKENLILPRGTKVSCCCPSLALM